jgi:hypothetical protein
VLPLRAVPAFLVLLLLMAPARAAGPGDLHVLAINGGGDRQDNFASHLAHLRQLTEVLTAAGVVRERITVLSGDGNDPAPDLATRDVEPENAWLLQGTLAEPLLSDFTSYENSTLPGIVLRPATVASLSRTLRELRTRLHPGDTLLFYVTDHGTESRRDPLDNRITLWGARESISVRKLGALLARLPPSVRVVSLMSQCFSGGFAYLHETRERSRIPSGATCGYFSSTPDRPAYGCYPEVRSQKAIGHSFEFLSALARHGRFADAHGETMVSDQTPDIPLRSSDVYLAELLARAAHGHDAAFADPLLRQALASGAYANESLLVDRIARVHSLARPATLAELDARIDALFSFLDEVEAHAKTWETALHDFNQANLEVLQAGKPVWRKRLQASAMHRLDPGARRDLALALQGELALLVGSDPARNATADRLLTGQSTLDEISYRSEIRVAALLRMRFLYTSVAGREWIKRNPAESKAAIALARCEDLSLPTPAPLPRTALPAETPKIPAFDEDQKRAAAFRPGWLGITFVPAGPSHHRGIPDGAARITSVVPGSPAAQAALRAGDVVTGTDGRVFTLGNLLRPLIVAAPISAPLALDVLRGNRHLVLRPIVGTPPPTPAQAKK